jgi:DNA-3-methyladenine glycosylase II
MLTPYHRHFRRHDPIIHGIARRVGLCQLKPSRDRFGMLVRSIISQQISVGAARSIRGKLEAQVGGARFRPDSLLQLTDGQMRAAGLSKQKLSYLRDLSQKSLDGSVNLSRISRLPDEAVIEQLTQVKGIGRWTAQMFLIFALGREDVFPIDDFGVRSAIVKLYQLGESPPKQTLLEIGARWSPFASIGSWYCWRYLDVLRSEKGQPAATPV